MNTPESIERHAGRRGQDNCLAACRREVEQRTVKSCSLTPFRHFGFAPGIAHLARRTRLRFDLNEFDFAGPFR